MELATSQVPEAVPENRTWWRILRGALRGFRKHACPDLAAALTYYAVLSLFPAALVVLSLLGLFGEDRSSVDAILRLLNEVGASSVGETIEPTLVELSAAPRAGMTLVLGVLAGLWSASSYVGAFGRGLNRIFEVDEERPGWRLRLMMLGVTIVTVTLSVVVALSLVMTGPAARAVGDVIGLGSTAVVIWNIAKWPAVLLIVAFIVALLYFATPNIPREKFRWVSVGSFVAIGTWLLASLAFGFYIANFASYDKTYGSLGGIVIFLLWLWLTNLALLFGAQIDAELVRDERRSHAVANRPQNSR
ncbi:MAG TPA: YihY/virulence factor BrkB family protein [Aeromicrobium sp.]|nr:YihY/virulence factor BrkB family protein [Aeromicrobium sp.]